MLEPLALWKSACPSGRQVSGGGKPVIHGGGHRGSRLGLDDSNTTLTLRRAKKTDDPITLRTLLEKTSDTDPLREMIGFSAERMLELEVQGLTGAA